MRRDTRSRAQRVREAILQDLQASAEPLRLGEMQNALGIARGRAEVYQQAQRLTDAGQLVRDGRGYADGEAHTYYLAERPAGT